MNNIVEPLQAAEDIERHERSMRKKWLDLPDELILKILSYSEVKDLISYGQVSKRTRNISQDSSLWVTANLEKKIVKTELLEMILNKGCKNLNISNSTIVGRFSLNIKSQLRVLDLSQSAWGFPTRDWSTVPFVGEVYYVDKKHVLEELLLSCCSLQRLEMEGLYVTSAMGVSICKNSETLQVLNLKHCSVSVPNNVFQSIIKCCQELRELDLNYINGHYGLTDDNLEFLAENIAPTVEKLNLCNQKVQNDHVKMLLSRCNKLKVLFLDAIFLSTDSKPFLSHIGNMTYGQSKELRRFNIYKMHSNFKMEF